MFNKGALGQLMKQAQQMQNNVQKVQEEIAAMEVVGQATGGVVKVTMSGKHDVRRVEIDDSVMDDREMLEDLLVLALNDASKQIEAASQQKMGAATAGMPMPPGMKFPF